MSFRVLFVCTANICRSPMAEHLFLHRVEKAGAGDRIEIESAGVRALTGHPMDDVAARAIELYGADGADHVAQQMTATLIRSSGLILTADADHRSRVVREVPAAMRRTFTLLEFARLGAPVADEVGPPRPCPGGNRLTTRVAEVAAQRGRQPVTEGSDDIGDPYRAGPEVMREAAARIAEAVDETCRILGVNLR